MIVYASQARKRYKDTAHPCPKQRARCKEGRKAACVDAGQLHEGEEPEVGDKGNAAAEVVTDYAPDGSALRRRGRISYSTSNDALVSA